MASNYKNLESSFIGGDVYSRVFNNVKPVLTTVTLVTNTYKDASNFNQKIKKLNTKITNRAFSRKIDLIDLIDLNLQLSNGDFLRSENATADGIHFTSKAYVIWREEIMKILEQEKV